MAARLTSLFGTPPSSAKLEHWNAWEVLHHTWAIKIATRAELEPLVGYVMLGLPVAEREHHRATLPNMRGFLTSKYRTETFKANLRAAFIRAYKSPQPVLRRIGGDGSVGSLSGPVALAGSAASAGRAPYPHQLEARTRLDELIAGANVKRRSGLLVLPTGAGKTSTVVDWLVPHLACDPKLRVLWLAHQHELLEQAARAFGGAAEQQDVEFRRRLRVISSNGCATSTLADPQLDVALVTWQSLNSSWDQRVTSLKTFIRNRTVVVVDEAHHAAAPGYQRILRYVRHRPGVSIVGLTATPWPDQDGAAQRLRNTFPVDVLI